MEKKKEYATCEYCGQEMKPGGCCTVKKYKFADGTIRLRIPYRATLDGAPCGDCNVGDGCLHHPGCDNEKCPKCGGQYISCGCE
jgi:hypothetical protein